MATKIGKRFRLVTGMAIGAAGMYFLDPRQGRGRRSTAKAQVGSKMRRAQREVDAQRRYAAGVAEGERHQGPPAHRPADDQTLVDRVKSVLGHAFPHDRVSMDAVDGVVSLRGELADQTAIEGLVARVEKVAGVKGVDNLLHLPGSVAPNKEPAEAASAEAERS